MIRPAVYSNYWYIYLSLNVIVLIIVLLSGCIRPICPTDTAISNTTDKPSTGSGPINLPTANGPCPEFTEGIATFSPKRIRPRKVRIWIGPEAQEKDGPIVFYWHGTGMSPRDAIWSIGESNINEIKCAGGIVVAPHYDARSRPYPWYIANSETREDDLLVADEILACAIQKVGIDTRRIHVTGMSAGGLIASDMALRRSYYVASTAPHSGGLWCDMNYSKQSKHGGIRCPPAYPLKGQCKSASMIIHGGVSDTGGYLNFEETSEQFQSVIQANGGFTVMCNHGQGHRITTNTNDAVWHFFKHYPWNTSPSPYAKGLPVEFPDYCRVP